MKAQVIKLFKDKVDKYTEIIKEIREINTFRHIYVGTMDELEKNYRCTLNEGIKQDIEKARESLGNIVNIFDERKSLLEKEAKKSQERFADNKLYSLNKIGDIK